MAEDGLPLRCLADHSERKHCILRAYIYIFSTSMKNKWRHLNYIDLFAGPGLCYNSKQRKEILGSPLLALKTKYQFTSLHLVELDSKILEILKKRLDIHRPEDSTTKIYPYNGDCNKEIDNIIKSLPLEWCLSLAFVDPEGFQFKFETLKKLVINRRVDLIINFPTRAVLRNIKRRWERKQSRLDNLVPGWRSLFSHAIVDHREATLKVLDLFKRKLEELGYREIKDENQIPVYSSSTQQKLYDLIFASKSPLGEKFWNAVARKAAQRLQRTLF